MKLDRKKFRQLLVGTVLVAVMVIPWLRAERDWAEANNPAGKFASIEGYLATGRLPGRVAKLSLKGDAYLIAYGPMDHGFAIPSGPAAYVFDASGRMVAWSRDTGDDLEFHKNWPMAQQEEASLADLRSLGHARQLLLSP